MRTRILNAVVLTVAFLVQRPAGTLQGEVDDQPAGLVLVPVVGLGDGLVLRLDSLQLFLDGL